MAGANISSAESATEWGSPSETAAVAAMVTLEILPGTMMTAFETVPGTAMAITVKRALFEPVMIVAAVFSDSPFEVMARSDVWTVEAMTRQITFMSRVFGGVNFAVTVVVILVDVRISKP
ncbi:MAG: hypothetical protein P8Y74_10470 [Desulfobacterales bacterium]|jgi:hypothetical protein